MSICVRILTVLVCNTIVALLPSQWKSSIDFESITKYITVEECRGSDRECVKKRMRYIYLQNSNGIKVSSGQTVQRKDHLI